MFWNGVIKNVLFGLGKAVTTILKMALSMKRAYLSRKQLFIIFLLLLMFMVYYLVYHSGDPSLPPDLDLTRKEHIENLQNLVNTAPTTVALLNVVNVSNFEKIRANIQQKLVYATNATPKPYDLNDRDSVAKYVEFTLQEALKEDKGTGCDVPKLDPFSPEVMRFNKEKKLIQCTKKDWVQCHLSKCRPTRETVEQYENIECVYNDIIHVNDYKRYYGPSKVVKGDEAYTLVDSDHVKIKCTGRSGVGITRHLHRRRRRRRVSMLFGKTSWSGLGTGLRSTVNSLKAPKGVHDKYDVLIFGFDTTSKNGFIRKMPVSYRYLTKELGATVLNGYNIVGDGTPAALFPILSGKTELDMPEARKSIKGSGYLEDSDFIFYKLKQRGYHTAYFEDMPWVGTFQYRFNGFRNQPADHYLRDLFLEESGMSGRSYYCFGETPRHRLMMNLTEQVFELDGRHFSFTFVADITHDDFSYMHNADVPLMEFLKRLEKKGVFKNTLLMVMGDHGPRYANIRDTFQGKLEERLPFMAIRLPDKLRAGRPEAQSALEANMDVLTTPHDIHATILDTLDLTTLGNPYKVQGADLPRALSLLEPVPRNRSCSEAGIEPHWCTCLRWEELAPADPMYERAAHALVDHINLITKSKRHLCALRNLESVQWVLKRKVNAEVLKFQGAKDHDGYIGKFNGKTVMPRQVYQVKITVGPNSGTFEAAVTYLLNQDQFQINSREISRINAYNDEPKCISETDPHLNMYCFCKS
ncbi:uncharacterized protein LOC126378228 [Pectinophora gossypiella]|uniref:uncharacterized protein LOC126378228 n=1 Tax=Pectinophora gossypiella TaxID=13191 RepID=UPI00214EC532|nr:uncharacterized protein LOC126378228 [Pectinophora gossypiella]